MAADLVVLRGEDLSLVSLVGILQKGSRLHPMIGCVVNWNPLSPKKIRKAIAPRLRILLQTQHEQPKPIMVLEKSPDIESDY
jgi:hypothetical protein